MLYETWWERTSSASWLTRPAACSVRFEGRSSFTKYDIFALRLPTDSRVDPIERSLPFLLQAERSLLLQPQLLSFVALRPLLSFWGDAEGQARRGRASPSSLISPSGLDLCCLAAP